MLARNQDGPPVARLVKDISELKLMVGHTVEAPARSEPARGGVQVVYELDLGERVPVSPIRHGRTVVVNHLRVPALGLVPGRRNHEDAPLPRCGERCLVLVETVRTPQRYGDDVRALLHHPVEAREDLVGGCRAVRTQDLSPWINSASSGRAQQATCEP